MPTITSTGKGVQTGPGEMDYRMPRASVQAATRRDLPTPSAQAPAPAQVAPGTAPAVSDPSKTGQADMGEDTGSSQPAVTLSPQLSALAKKSQKLQAEIQAQRDKEAQWEKERGEYVRRPDLQAKLKQNASEALKEAFGLDYEGLTALLLEQQNGADPVRALAEEVKSLKAEREQDVNKQYEATLKQYKAETTALVEKDPKKFFFIKQEDAFDQVVQHIVETWEEDPDTVLTVEQAAAEIEEILREDAKKRKALLEELEKPEVEPTDEEPQAAAPAQAKPPKQTQPLPPPGGARTLTERVAAPPAPRSKNQFQHMSMQERIQAAMARAQGNG